MYTSLLGGKQVQAVVESCPHCSYLWEGKCVICDDDDPHPGCQDCEDGHPKPVPWYKSEFVASIVGSMIVAVISSIVVIKLTGMQPSYRQNPGRR